MANALDERLSPYADTSVRFRPADLSDRGALLTLCAAYRRADSQPQASALVSAAIDAALAGDALIRLFMIELLEESEQPSEHASLLVGYLAISLGFSIEAGGRDAFIDEIYVEPQVQRRGLGKRAFSFADGLCRELGVRRICLEVERHNERAQALYKQLGFRDHERLLLSRRLDER
jgi:ribosomal protein S18 acetylase RimI-like enzyme